MRTSTAASTSAQDCRRLCDHFKRGCAALARARYRAAAPCIAALSPLPLAKRRFSQIIPLRS
jgi:hypothetical protein